MSIPPFSSAPGTGGGGGAETDPIVGAITGIVKANGAGTISAAVAGTDYVAPNGAITGATKTKITYDAKGLVTAGANATTADIADSTDKRYVTDAQSTVLGNTSGTNTGDQTSVSGNAGTATALQTGRTIDGQTFNGTANITVIAPGTHAATGKTTPVDADELPLVDSAASNVLKKLTWANLKATLKTYFDALYPSGSGTSSGTNTGDQLIFKTISVSGQSDVVADTTADTLTLAAGSNITLTTNASTDTVTIAAAGDGVAGSDTQVQFNDGGTAFGGDADFTWDKTSNLLSINGDLNLKADAVPTQRNIIVADQTTVDTNGSNLLVGAGRANGSADGGNLVLRTGPAQTIGPIAFVFSLQSGSGYIIGDILTLVGGNNDALLTVSSVNGGGAVTGATITSAGTGYSTALFSVSGGSGTGEQFFGLVNSGHEGEIRLPASESFDDRIIRVEDSTGTVGGTSLKIYAGSAGAGTNGAGGIFVLSAGDGDGTEGGGSFNIFSGAAGTGGDTDGGSFNISSRDANGDGNGGNFTLTSGSAFNAGNGGAFSFIAGNTDTGAAGNMSFTAGQAIGVGGIGGDVNFNVGGGDTPGKFKFSGAVGRVGVLDFESLTDTRNFSFQDKTGTLAHLDDIPTGTISKTDTVSSPAQGADIADTALSVSAPGLFRISYYMLDTTADLTAGAVTLNIKFTDDVAARSVNSSPVVLTATSGFTQGTIIANLQSGSLTYGVTHTGIFGSATYALYLTCEELN